MIRKQILEINLNKDEDAFQIQNGMSRFYWKQVLPALEKIFDELSEETETLQLDHLEIDLGRLNSEMIISGNTYHELYNLLRKQVEQAIAIQRKNKSTGKPLSMAAQWMHYMEFGWLDWNLVKIEADWDQKVLEAFATDYASISALRTLMQKKMIARERIVMRHDEVFLLRLLKVLTAENQDQLLAVIKDLREFFLFFRFPWMQGRTTILDSMEKKIWAEAILLSAIHGNKMHSRALAGKILNTFIKSGSERIVLNFLTTANLSDSILKNILEEKIASAKNEAKDNAEELRQVEAKEEPVQLEPEREILEDGIFVQDAGLVLLHPFLASFFSRLGIVFEGEFIDLENHQKALYLLYYLAHGQLPVEEHELLMPKLLLAYPLQQIVPMNLSLAEEEKREAESLVESVIDKWDILKNTSIAGLREGFLQRSGKYFLKNENFYLQVEQGSIDMLLDYLPWNLSIIKLPWMENLLRVEWR